MAENTGVFVRLRVNIINDLRDRFAGKMGYGMSDKELLEMAAKAAGIERILWNGNYPGGWLDGCGAPSTWWNPLTDDGDALRLAVKLKLEVDITYTGVAVRTQYGQKVLVDSVEERNAYTATRRAIVRAAAEIGKA